MEITFASLLVQVAIVLGRVALPISETAVKANNPEVRAEIDLPSLLMAAPFDPIEDEELQAARRKTLNALASVEKVLKGKKSSRVRKLLNWKEVRVLLDDPAKNSEQLAEVLTSLYRDEKGIERKSVLNFRSALRNLVNRTQAAAQTDLALKFEAQRKGLAQELTAYLDAPSGPSAIEINKRLEWLHRTQQAADFLKQARRVMAQPNFLAHVDRDLVTPVQFKDPVKQKSKVNDVILGTTIWGDAKTVGKLRFKFLPSETRGIFQLIFEGKTESKTAGVNGPARIRSTGHTNVTVRTPLYFTDRGVKAGKPVATARTRSRLDSLYAPRKIFKGLTGGRRPFVEKIARKKAGQMQGQADYIAARHAEREFEKNFVEQVALLVKLNNEPYVKYYLHPLERIGALHERAIFSTLGRTLTMNMLYADGVQLAADSSPPEFSKRRRGFDVRIHESCIRNAGQLMLRGMSGTDEMLAAWMRNMLGEIPREAREYRLGPHLERWSASLADEYPLDCEIRGDQVALTVKISQVERSGKQIKSPTVIHVVYRIEYTVHGPRFVRVGSVDVTPQNWSPEIADHNELLSFIRRKAEGFFLSEMFFDGLVPPVGGGWDSVAQMSFRELIFKDGWIGGSWAQEE